MLPMESYKYPERAKHLYLENLLTSMRDLRQEESSYDVLINCDGRQFKAHRVLLSSVSSYFRAMFKGGFKESSFVDGISHVNICEFKADIVEILLEIIYSPKGSYTPNQKVNTEPGGECYKSFVRDLNMLTTPSMETILTLSELLRAMKYFQIAEQLINELGREIKLKFETMIEFQRYEHAMYLFNLISATGDKKHIAELESVMKRCTRDLEAFIRQGYFAEIESYEAVQNLIKHHDISTRKEVVLLKAVLSWIGKDPLDRVKHLDHILCSVKFNLISKDDVKELIFSAGLFTRLNTEIGRDVWKQIEHILSSKLSFCCKIDSKKEHSKEVLLVMNGRNCNCGWNLHQSTVYETSVYDTLTGHVNEDINSLIPELHPDYCYWQSISTLEFGPIKQLISNATKGFQCN